MGKLITIWEFIGRHKYWITVVAFGVIIGFLDENSMIRRIGYAREISRLQGEIDKYRAEYEEYGAPQRTEYQSRSYRTDSARKIPDEKAQRRHLRI